MKLAGRTIQGPNVVTLVIPRPPYERPRTDPEGRPIPRTGDDGKPLVGTEDEALWAPDEKGVLIPAFDMANPPILSDGKPPFEVDVVPGDLVFKFQAVLDYSEFEAICPEPKPGKVLRRGESTPVDDMDNPKYMELRNRWATFQTHWMFLKSIAATDGLEWTTIDMGNPDTWKNYVEELKQAGFVQAEITRMLMAVMESNALNEDRFKEAKARFLATQAKGNGRVPWHRTAHSST